MTKLLLKAGWKSRLETNYLNKCHTVFSLLKAAKHYIAYYNTFDKSSLEQLFYHCEFSHTNI